MTAAVMQNTLTGCFAKSTASASSVVISKGTLWSALAGGKKLVMSAVAVACLIVVGLAFDFLKSESDNQESTNSQQKENKQGERAELEVLPTLEDILAKQFERSEIIQNYEVRMKTSYYKNLSVIKEYEEFKDKEPYQTEYIDEVVRWEEPKYYANRALSEKGDEVESLLISYNGEFTLSDVSPNHNNKFTAGYKKGGSSKALWSDANSYSMFYFLNFKLFEENKIRFSKGRYKVRGWAEFNGEKCVVIHEDQDDPNYKGSIVDVYWFSADREFRPVKGEYYSRRAEGSKDQYGRLGMRWEIKYKDMNYGQISLPESWHAEKFRYGKLLSSRTSKEIKYEINKDFKKEDFQIPLQEPIQVQEYISSRQQLTRTLNPDGTLEPIKTDHLQSDRKSPVTIIQDNLTYFILVLTAVIIMLSALGHYILKRIKRS